MTASSSPLAPRWRRIARWLPAAALLAYLLAATSLWAYYRYSRNVPAVRWIDIAVCTRFGRVQQAVGAQHLAQAKELWTAGEYAKGIFLARAAVAKCPQDPDARIFLATCWQQVGRIDFACRTLEDGLASDPAALPLARTLLSFYLQGGDTAICSRWCV